MGSLWSYHPGRTRTRWLTDKLKVKHRHTLHSVTQHTLLVGTRWRETQQFAVSMHDLRVYLKINKVSTLLMFNNEHTHVNCLPTSLLDHFFMTSKRRVIGKQKKFGSSFWNEQTQHRKLCFNSQHWTANKQSKQIKQFAKDSRPQQWNLKSQQQEGQSV